MSAKLGDPNCHSITKTINKQLPTNLHSSLREFYDAMEKLQPLSGAQTKDATQKSIGNSP